MIETSKFATFLAFAAAACAAAGVFLLTDLLVSPSDKLSAAVPSNAAFYTHGDFAALYALAAALPADARAELARVPNGVHPYDAAVFAVPEEDRLVWGAAIGWRVYPAPSAEEDRLLRQTGWKPAGRSVYAIGLASRIDRPDSTPLIETAGRSLRTMADVLPMQGYLAPARIPAQAVSPQLTFLKELEPMVFGLDASSSPVFGLVMPAADAEAQPPLLGFGMPSQTAGKGGQQPSLDAARLTVTSRASVIDPLNVLFSHVEEARQERQAPPTEEYLVAAEDLRTILSGPITLSLLTDGADSRIRYVAGFPASSPEMLKAAIAAYLSSSLPEKKKVSLPDKTVSVELEVDPDKYRFSAVEGSDIPGAEMVADKENELTVVVAPDGRGGAYLSTEAGYIKEIMEKEQTSGSGRCRQPADASVLDLRSSWQNFSKVRVISIGDKLLLACGYH